MRIVVVGADFEENLGLGMIAAALEAAGHTVTVMPFQNAAQTQDVVTKILARKPALVGLSLQFQHRAHEFLTLASRLRARGFRGHLTCGGQFPTLAWQEVLAHHPAIDSVVLHEGEQTMVELAGAIDARTPWLSIPGLAVRDENGCAVRRAGRPLEPNLDRLPFAKRYRPHTTHLGVPFIPITASRGCWGRCSYCSITSFHRDAREHGGGRLLRLRTPENVAAEMALLWHGAGGPSVFCFHDDSFLLPRPQDTIDRLEAIRRHLDTFGVGKVGLIGKCRPETLTPDLALRLRELGVIRLYVGVENGSQRGADHLNRRTTVAAVREALRAARETGIFACYNLLIFEPRSTLEDVLENIAFMREHAMHPVNFCRAEPYHGTPLQKGLVGHPSLGGSYLGWDYRIDDDKAEVLFRICAAAFRERNFAPRGVANRSMGLGYSLKLIEHFHEERLSGLSRIRRQADEVTRGIVLETAGFLEEAANLVEQGDPERIARETALLGLRIAAHDAAWHASLDDLQAQMDGFVGGVKREHSPMRPTRKLMEAVQGLAVAGLLAVGVSACGGRATSDDPVPPDAGVDADNEDAVDAQVVDPLPEDGGVEADVMVSDPPPWDAGVDHVDDPLPEDASVDADAMVSDPPPWDAGVDHVDDPLPEDAGFEDQVSDPPPPDAGFYKSKASDHWTETSPKRALRSRDLPLFEPPHVKLTGRRTGEGIVVRVVGGADAMTLRWEGDGIIEGEGREVLWRPGSGSDQLRLGTRTVGGVAVVTLRACDV